MPKRNRVRLDFEDVMTNINDWAEGIDDGTDNLDELNKTNFEDPESEDEQVSFEEQVDEEEDDEDELPTLLRAPVRPKRQLTRSRFVNSIGKFYYEKLFWEMLLISY